ncbi:MAG: hypothetical protein R8K50_07980 [Mariprofundus sp.]
MLALLCFWREQCDAAQLAAYEQHLEAACHDVISSATLNKRYQDSYHRALINGKFIRAAIRTGERENQNGAWIYGSDFGEVLTQKMVTNGGYLARDAIEPRFDKTLATLLERGVLFAYQNYYCLPAEAAVELLEDSDSPSSLLELAAATIPTLLAQLVPTDAQQAMLKPKPTRGELSAWLTVQGTQACLGKINESLNADDWGILLELQHQNLDDFEQAQTLYPELPVIQIPRQYYYNNKQESSLRKALEASIPEQLCKLCRLGLIGIVTRRGDASYACIKLSNEGRKALEPYWQLARDECIMQLQSQWQAEPCAIEQASLWSMDQQMWRLWVALHFLPAGITQQKRLRKNDIKKIAAALHTSDNDMLEYLIATMLYTGLLKADTGVIQTEAINWQEWSGSMLVTILDILQGWDHWDDAETEKAIQLLRALPVDIWLKLDEVVDWLRMQADGNLVSAHWMGLFIENQTITLNHVNIRNQSIYLLPLFHAVLDQEPVNFPAPGWHGADDNAKTHGFISAAGEIQLPPDCNHSILPRLAEFCTLTSVEQMITLQLDSKALQRMGSNKDALKQCRSLLESVQSPLPQPVAYLFEKQQSQKPVAAVAATALVVLLHDPAALPALHKTGFNFSQPFADKPEILLLDTSSDAHAFVTSCVESGIMLDILIKPVQWISGTASINAWMQTETDRQDNWLEISYQKMRSSAPKQIYARIENDYYGKIEVQPVRQSKKGFTFLKTILTLEPKHIVRLRELDAAELKEIGLEQLA